MNAWTIVVRGLAAALVGAASVAAAGTAQAQAQDMYLRVVDGGNGPCLVARAPEG